MKNTKFIAIFATAFALTTVFTSCQKDETAGTNDTLTGTTGDAAQSQLIGDEAIDASEEYASNANFMSSGAQKVRSEVSRDSVEVSIVRPDSSAIVVNIDFGNQGIRGRRGNILKGELSVEINRSTFTRTITYNNFSVNDNTIRGYRIVTKGKNDQNQITWNITSRDTILLKTGESKIWNSDRVRTLTNDNNTPSNPWDDVYSVTGSANGINTKGKAYSLIIDSNNPLIFYTDYIHFVQGSMKISSEQKTALLDYGDGTKDDKATIIIDGKTKDITLGK
jgi:hypothetical protein